MIQIIAGREGSGKTKSLIDMANTMIKQTDGHIVYVDADKSHLFNLNHKIRLVKTEDFMLETAGEFFGLVCGILSQDYDIKTIFIDGLLQSARIDASKVDSLIHKIETVSENDNVDFIISICCAAEELPESVQKFLI